MPEYAVSVATNSPVRRDDDRYWDDAMDALACRGGTPSETMGGMLAVHFTFHASSIVSATRQGEQAVSGMLAYLGLPGKITAIAVAEVLNASGAPSGRTRQHAG